MNTLLVTGGAGFIGSCLVRHLVRSQDFHVVNLDLLTYAGNLNSLAEVADSANYTFVHGDIGNLDLVSALLAQHQPTGILHLAAESHVDRSIDSPDAFVQTNVVGTYRLLEACLTYWQGLSGQAHERFRFLQVSTDEVFGSLNAAGAFDEDSCYAPNSPYSASKAAADHLVRSYHQTYGLPTLITYSPNNYGPFQFPEKLVPLTTLNAMEEKPTPIYGDGKQVRDWLYVEDHVEALALILGSGVAGDSYCVGANNELTNLAMVQAVCDAVDRHVSRARSHPSRDRIEFVADRPGHDRRYALDASKVRKEVGWQPKRDLASGIDATVKWYLENDRWLESIASGGYRRDQRLGLSRFKTK